MKVTLSTCTFQTCLSYTLSCQYAVRMTAPFSASLLQKRKYVYDKLSKSHQTTSNLQCHNDAKKMTVPLILSSQNAEHKN